MQVTFLSIKVFAGMLLLQSWYSRSWKRQPKQESTEGTETINGNPTEGFGHASMAQNMEEEPVLGMGTDKMIPRYVYDKSFIIRFPDRTESKDEPQTERNEELQNKQRHWNWGVWLWHKVKTYF
jgi:hypothetical protein